MSTAASAPVLAAIQLPPMGGYGPSALRPFPDRRPAFEFRSITLEQIYRDLGHLPFDTLVDPEGSVVWVSEYLRYRVGQCSADAAFQRIVTQINGGGVPAPCGDIEQPFPDRRDALDFRRRLEQVYRSRGAGPANTRVNDEGDVIWTMEYLRYVLSGCSHDLTISKIRDQIAGRGVPAPCTVVVPPAELRADFSVTPNNLQVAAPGQCITESAAPNNILRCTFDGGLSTPAEQITSYEWDFFDGVKTFNTRTLRDVTVPCGSVGSAAGATRRPVTLTVRGSGGRSNSRRIEVTFVKPTFC